MHSSTLTNASIGGAILFYTWEVVVVSGMSISGLVREHHKLTHGIHDHSTTMWVTHRRHNYVPWNKTYFVNIHVIYYGWLQHRHWSGNRFHGFFSVGVVEFQGRQLPLTYFKVNSADWFSDDNSNSFKKSVFWSNHTK